MSAETELTPEYVAQLMDMGWPVAMIARFSDPSYVEFALCFLDRLALPRDRIEVLMLALGKTAESGHLTSEQRSSLARSLRGWADRLEAETDLIARGGES